MKLKIILADTYHNYNREGLIACPMNVAYLSAYASNKFGSEIDIVICNSFDGMVENVKKHKPHIVGLSNYVWNYFLNIELCKVIKSIDDKILIVMGGPNIKITNEEIRIFFKQNPFVDIYVFGQGEIPFFDILKYCLNNPEILENSKKEFKGNIPGCAFLNGEKVIYEKNIIVASDIEKIPSPYLTGKLDAFIKNEFWQLFETNRGCPFSCSYCDYPLVAGRKIIQFPMERIFAEFEYALSKGQSKVWFLVDANFGIFERDLLIAEKLRQLLEHKDIRLVYFASKDNRERVLEIAKILSPMARTTLIGIQSLNNKVLKVINRRNIDDKSIRDSIDYYKREKISVKIDLIMGLPEADMATHIDDFKKAFRFGFDHIEGFALRLLPSSEIATSDYKEKYGIRTAFRPVSGLLGVYNDKKIIEYEENVIATNKLKEDEYHYVRVFYWMVWFGFNLGFLKILFDLLINLGENPADFIEEFLSRKVKDFPLLNEMVENFYKESKAEWFYTLKEADSYYKDLEVFNKLLYGQRRLNTRYFANIIYDDKLRNIFMSCLAESAKALIIADTDEYLGAKKCDIITEIQQCVDLLNRIWIKFQDFEQKEYRVEQIFLDFKGKMAEVLSRTLNIGFREEIKIRLYYKKDDVNKLKKTMDRYNYVNNPILAIEKIILSNYGAHLVDNLMQYKIEVLNNKPTL